MASPFRRHQRFFCRPMALSMYILARYPQPVTFHQRRWSQVWPRCPGSSVSPLYSNGECPILIECACLPSHGLSFPLSIQEDAIGQVVSPISTLLSNVDRLTIHSDPLEGDDDLGNGIRWLA